MSQAIEEIIEALTVMLEKLKTIETEITSQKEDIRTYFETRNIRTDFDEQLILRIHALTTSVELLRDEVDELNAPVIMLLKKHKEM